MNEPVTSVSKRETKLTDSAAAIFVITQEDIRRSGLTSVPELLRMVPGINVARIDANRWAISARGFNGQFARKMQMLIDGRDTWVIKWGRPEVNAEVFATRMAWASGYFVDNNLFCAKWKNPWRKRSKTSKECCSTRRGLHRCPLRATRQECEISQEEQLDLAQ